MYRISRCAEIMINYRGASLSTLYTHWRCNGRCGGGDYCCNWQWWRVATCCVQVYSNAATPYHGLSDDDVLLTLASGAARPVCPAGICPDWMQRLVTACSTLKPHDRVTPDQLTVSVGKCLAEFAAAWVLLVANAGLCPHVYTSRLQNWQWRSGGSW